jgi:uncharacterized membrane protein YhhN
VSAVEARRPAPALRLVDYALLAGATAAAAGWFAVLLAGADSGRWLPVKGATVALLALWALTRRGEVEGAAALALALLAHAAGDVLLELSFLAGVGAFFAGHLLYIRLFWRHRLDLDDVGANEKLALGALALVAAGFLLVLRSRLHGELAVAVPLYAAALATMGGAACLSRHGRPWVPLGALLFVLSDALLSLQLFAAGVAGGRLAVWPLYVLGQGAIAWGWLTGSSAERAVAPPPL